MFTTLLLLSTLALTSSPPPANDVALQLERRTQELLDAIAAGNREPWARYLHDDLVYAAEDGSIKSKAQLLEELQPLPKQIWGKLRIAHFRMVRSGATAVCSNTIRRDGDGLVGQRTGRKPETLRPEVADYFFMPGQPRLRKVFQRDAAGRITGFVERRETWDIVWRRKD